MSLGPWRWRRRRRRRRRAHGGSIRTILLLLISSILGCILVGRQDDCCGACQCRSVLCRFLKATNQPTTTMRMEPPPHASRDWTGATLERQPYRLVGDTFLTHRVCVCVCVCMCVCVCVYVRNPCHSSCKFGNVSFDTGMVVVLFFPGKKQTNKTPRLAEGMNGWIPTGLVCVCVCVCVCACRTRHV